MRLPLQDDIPGHHVLLIDAIRADVKIKTERGIDDSFLMIGAYFRCNFMRHNETQVSTVHVLEENDLDRPALLPGKGRSKESFELRHLPSLKGAEPPICLQLARDGKVAHDEGVIIIGVPVIEEHGVEYLRHKRLVSAVLDGPDVGDTASAGVKSLYEGDGHEWWSGGESDALVDRLLVAVAERCGGRRVHICKPCAGWRGGLCQVVEVEGCPWVVCTFE